MGMLKGLFVFLAVLLTALTAHAEEIRTYKPPQVEYSANGYFEAGGVTMTSRVNYAPGKERREMDAGGSVMISRTDKKLVWILMPDQKKYMETRADDKHARKDNDISDYKIEMTTVGRETIEGISTTKYKIAAINPRGDKLDGFMWVTKEGILMKMDAVGASDGRKERMLTGLKGLKIAKQDPGLFEIPGGYEPMNMPAFNMEEMMKAQKEEAAGKKEAESGRPYTSSPGNDTGTPSGESTADKVVDPINKIWKMWGK